MFSQSFLHFQFARSDRGPHKMMLVVRKDLKMGQGKIAAQCGHATLAAYKLAQRKAPKALAQWGRQGQPKIAAKVDSEDGLMEVRLCLVSA